MTFPFYEVVSNFVIREDRFHICLKRVHFLTFSRPPSVRARRRPAVLCFPQRDRRPRLPRRRLPRQRPRFHMDPRPKS